MTGETRTRIRPRDRDAILQSLSAGVVPRRGHHHIQVGRADELDAMVRDLERIADGGSAIRFIIGRYGSGKTFFLHLVRTIAHEKGLVTAHADLAPDRRLRATGGEAQNLYAELTRNLATRTKPEGGAMQSVVERFVTRARQDAKEQGRSTSDVIHDRLAELHDMVRGYDFATVIDQYWKGYETGDEALRGAAVRWLRGEYTTKTDVKEDLKDVRNYVDDKAVYDHLKLLGRFVALAGYGGLMVALDEMVNLYKISHGVARRSNYEQILRIVNDCLQGSVEHVGFVMAGTPEFLMDTRRGLYSYEALQTRLSQNMFAGDGLKDLSGPVIQLTNLSQEELYHLLEKLRHVQAQGDAEDYLIPDDGLKAFMRHCNDRIGAKYFQTPRNTIKAFVQLLAVLDQNPQAEWQDLLGSVEIEEDTAPSLDVLEDEVVEDGGDDELSSFTL